MKRTISICIITLLLALMIGGCGSKMSDAAEAPARGPSSAPSGAAQSSPAAPAGAAPASAAPSHGAPSDQANNSGAQWEPDAEGGMGTLPILTPSNSRGKRYVYTLDLKLQTTSFMAGIRTLLSTIGRMDGYVESADLRGNDLHYPPHERDAEYTIRLYTERLADFVEVIEDNYNIVSLRQRGVDVTGSYEYGESAIDDFRRQEARLITALENTRLETEDRLNIEKQLAQIQSDIRYYEREQSGFDDGIFYSTINVQLFEVIFPEEVVEEEEEEEEEVVIPDPTFGERFREAASRSWNGFTAFCQGLLIVLVRIAPTVLVLVVVAVVALLVYRGVRRFRRKRDAGFTDYTQGSPGQANRGGPDGYGGSNNKDDPSGQ